MTDMTWFWDRKLQIPLRIHGQIYQTDGRLVWEMHFVTSNNLSCISQLFQLHPQGPLSPPATVGHLSALSESQGWGFKANLTQPRRPGISLIITQLCFSTGNISRRLMFLAHQRSIDFRSYKTKDFLDFFFFFLIWYFSDSGFTFSACPLTNASVN